MLDVYICYALRNLHSPARAVLGTPMLQSQVTANVSRERNCVHTVLRALAHMVYIYTYSFMRACVALRTLYFPFRRARTRCITAY